MAVTTGMVGHGFYNENSAPQHAANAYVLPWLDAAVAELPLDDAAATIGFADFGCSEGRNSIAVMQRLVTTLRSRTAQPVLTVHSDLPTNDFSSLLPALRADDTSVFGAADVYSAAVGGSMYEQLLPPRSLHLATTFNAIGFFGRRPLDRFAGHILPNGPRPGGSGAVSADERAAFAAQAAADVVAFLEARAAELVPGGKLLVQVFGASAGHWTCDGIYDALNDALLEAVAAGQIGREAYETFYQPVYMRALDELTAPVSGPDAPCAELYSLDRAETYPVPAPFVAAWRADGDTARYAADYTNFFRAFTEPVVRGHFGGVADIDALIDTIYTRAEQRVATDPDRYPYNYEAVAMLLTRNG